MKIILTLLFFLSIPEIFALPLPQSLSFGGAPIPLNKDHVREALDREITLYAYDKAQVEMWLKRSARFFPYFESTLKSYGLHDDLKYLAVAESALMNSAQSSASAKGLWQFIPNTGKHYGFEINNEIDDRLDPEKSTHIMARYFKSLLAMMNNNYPLAAASYNAGPYRIMQFMREQRQNDFFELYMATETERYIYKIAAIKYIFENRQALGLDIKSEDFYKPLALDRVSVQVSQQVQIVDLAEKLSISYKVFKRYNPHIQGSEISPGTLFLFIPRGQSQAVANFLSSVVRLAPLTTEKENTPSLPPAPVEKSQSTYTVQKGETLLGIAKRNNISLDEIKRLNNLKSSSVFMGQKLKIK